MTAMPSSLLGTNFSVARILVSDETSFHQVCIKELSKTAKSTESPKGEDNSGGTVIGRY